MASAPHASHWPSSLAHPTMSVTTPPTIARSTLPADVWALLGTIAVTALVMATAIVALTLPAVAGSFTLG